MLVRMRLAPQPHPAIDDQTASRPDALPDAHRGAGQPRRRQARHRTLALLALSAIGVAAACSDDKSVDGTASSGSAPVGSGATSSYSTRFFDPPLDIDLPLFLDPAASDEAAHLVSWGSPDGSVAVRVLRPVVVYAPGATTTSQVPTDYVRYLLGQADRGGHLVDQVDTEVDGHEATVLTATTDEPIDGAIGCPDTATTADKCFGLQPEFVLRIAIIATDQGPVLIWLRSNVDAAADVAAASERLDSFLDGVHFADRGVETASTATAVDTEYDGTYTWTITKEDALAYGTASDKTPESLALYPNTFTATLEDGQFTLRETSSGHEESDRYEASSGRLILDPTGSGLTAEVTRDPDGTLHLTALPPILDAGGVFILTTKPWVPVAAGADCSNPEGGSTNTCLDELSAGRHETSTFAPALSYDVPADWSNLEDLPGNFLLLPPGSTLAGVNPGTSDFLGVYSSVAAPEQCTGNADLRVERTPAALVEYLQGLGALTVSDPLPVTIGGLSGLRVDLTFDDATADQACHLQDEQFYGGIFVDVIVGVGRSSLVHSVAAGYPLRMVFLQHGRDLLAIEVADAPHGGSDYADWLPQADHVVSTFRFS
jgi:hypothetical protein